MCRIRPVSIVKAVQRPLPRHRGRSHAGKTSPSIQQSSGARTLKPGATWRTADGYAQFYKHSRKRERRAKIADRVEEKPSQRLEINRTENEDRYDQDYSRREKRRMKKRIVL